MSFVSALHKLARPYLTALVATIFNGVLAYLVIMGKMPIGEYIAAVGPTNGMIVGFWFGERAALKDPHRYDAESEMT